MRFKLSIVAALAFAGIPATDSAAQTEVNPPAFAASTLAPLPASLVPDTGPAGDVAPVRISARRVLISTGIGTLAGAGAGLLLGAVTTDGCQDDEEWCILGWEEEVAIHGVAGAMVGAGVGALYGLVSGSRRPAAQPRPITVAPAADGALTVGLTLRH